MRLHIHQRIIRVIGLGLLLCFLAGMQSDKQMQTALATGPRRTATVPKSRSTPSDHTQNLSARTVSGAEVSYRSAASRGPKLEVTSISVSPDQVSVGASVTLEATIQNTGDQRARNVLFTTVVSEPKVDIVETSPERGKVLSLAAGETIEYQSVMVVREAGQLEIGVMALADNAVLRPESFELEIVEGPQGIATAIPTLPTENLNAGLVRVNDSLEFWSYLSGDDGQFLPHDPVNLIFIGWGNPFMICGIMDHMLTEDWELVFTPDMYPDIFTFPFASNLYGYIIGTGWKQQVCQLQLGDFFTGRSHIRVYGGNTEDWTGGSWSIAGVHHDGVGHRVTDWDGNTAEARVREDFADESFVGGIWTAFLFNKKCLKKGEEVDCEGVRNDGNATVIELFPSPPDCPPSGGAILYKHAGYNCGGEGEDRGYVRKGSTGWQNVPGEFNDQASSIKVPSGWSVKLFEHSNREGGWTCRNGDDEDFSRASFNNGVNLNDQVSSLEVFDSLNCGGVSCSDVVSVGEGSTRRQLFVDAYNRNGGRNNLGCTEDRTRWWPGTQYAPSGPQSVVIQDFTGAGGFGDAAIIHDEQRDNPQNSVPAYVVHGAIWVTYRDMGGPDSWLGPPTSDEFNNGSHAQSNFRNGYITWSGGNWQAYSWPDPDGNWRAEYFNGRNVSAYPTYVRNEANIDHDWGTGAPSGGRRGVWSDNFSVRWTKTESLEGGRYRFRITSDDGVRLWIDNQLVIDEWHDSASQNYEADVTLSNGNHGLRLEYYENQGAARVQLTWDRVDPPPNQPPHAPGLESPANGHVEASGAAPTLCWRNNGDPDDNPATLRFNVEVQGANTAGSGWIDRTCWRPASLDGHEGAYSWRVKARDGDGAESGWSTAWHFTIEPPPNDPPSISFDTANGDSFPAGSIGSRERNWTFRGTASDPEGRLQAIEFRCNGDNCGTQAGHTNGSNWSHTQNGMAGKNDVYFVAFDDQHSVASRHLDLRIDLAPSVTTLSLNNEANPNRWPAWFRGPVQVRLKATDHGTGRARSGVKEIHYRLDGGAWQTRAGDTVAFTVSSDGTHTVDYYAVDNMGNPEGSRSVTFKIDQTPPSPPSGINETGCHVISNQWQTCNTPRFTWAASTDATSGLAYYEFYFGANSNGTAVHQRFNATANRLWTPKPAGVRTGTYYLRGRTRDIAGNRSAWVNLFTFRYDGTPPENPKEAAHAAGIANDTWQRITNIPDFTWPVPYDEGSGIKGYHVFWGTDPNGTSSDFITNNQYLISNPLCDANAACTGYLRLRSVDNVDNPAEDWSTTFILRYDNVPPTVDFTFHGDITRTTQTLVTLDITADDQGSGVRAMRLSNNGKDWTDWEVPATQRLWTIPAISRQWWPVYLQVQDGVDLVSDVISHTVYLDVNPQQPRSASFRLFDHALSAGVGVYTATTGTGEVIYRGRGTVGQVIGHNVDAAQLTSLNYLIVGGYEAGSQALPITEPGHDESSFINGIFASGTGADTLRSPLYQMLGTLGEVGLPNNETTLTSQNHQFQPGFLAAAPPTTPTPTPEPGPTPTPEPTPACEFPQISINDGAPFTNSAEVTLSICAPRAAEMMLSNDGGFGDAQWEPYTESKPWTLTTYGQYVLPRFVYAAFKDTDGTVHGVYFDDIIRDPNPPSGTINVDDSAPPGSVLQATLAGGTKEGVALLSAGRTVKYVQRLGDKVLDRPMALLSTQDTGAVDLYLNAQDDNSGLKEMQISASGTFTDTTWEPYSALKPWTPTGGDGVKTLYARFRDSADNVSQPGEASFVLDTLPPFGGIAIFSRVVGPDVVTATVYLGAQDNLSGVADMRISADSGLTDAAWRPYTTTLTWPISFTVQSEGALYVQYRDLAGNASAVYSDTYQVDTTPPELYVTVAAGDTLTRTVSVYAYDALARVETMYLSNDPLMIDGVVTLPYSETVEWNFDERREVWVQVEDSVGNISEPFPAYAPPGCDLVGNDGLITATDVQTVAGRWREPMGLPYDRDGDNRVTVADIMWYASRWGQSCQ